jgi:putative membrane protein
MFDSQKETTKRNFPDYLKLFLKGVGMGAADVVPGVSGGTVAFITNIYEELIHSITTIITGVKEDLLKAEFKRFFGRINLSFLIVLISGIGTSVVLLAGVVIHLLNSYPVAIWSFFFGLIVASALVIYRRVRSFSAPVLVASLLGIVIAYFITVITPAQTTEASWFIFVSGFIAICAMILPGISGSFILLLLGKYEFILTSIREFKVDVILLFIAGCVSGLAVFSSVLDWLLRKYHDVAVALLAGFMIGSLNKVWPWKHTLRYFTDSHGDAKPLIQDNVMPETYRAITDSNPQVMLAAGLAVLGFVLVVFIDRLSGKNAAPES